MPREHQCLPVQIGTVTMTLDLLQGELQSLGSVAMQGTPVHNTQKRFLPWCDTVECEVFQRYLLQDVESDVEMARIKLRAKSDQETMFRGQECPFPSHTMRL